MKYCVRCGASLQDDALFCDKCGNKVGELDKYGSLFGEENDKLKGQRCDNKNANTVDESLCIRKESPSDQKERSTQNGTNDESRILPDNAINKNVRNRILAGVLLVCIGCFVFFFSHDSTKGLQVGDCVKFGTYADEPIEWKVLAVDYDKKLLVTRYGIDTVNYNKYNQDITWENSYIRRWLNENLYSNAFNHSERKR